MYLYITDTMSVERLYCIALPYSYLYCVVLMLFQEINNVFNTMVDFVVLLSRNINHNLVNFIFSDVDQRSTIVLSYNADVL